MKITKFRTRALTINFLIWGIFILANILASLVDSARAGREVNFLYRSLTFLISFGPWAFISPVFYWVIENARQKANFSILKTACFLAVGWLPLAMLFDAVSTKVSRPVVDKSIFELFLEMPAWYWTYQLLLFGVTFGACIAIIYYRRSSKIKFEAIRVKQQNADNK